MSTAIEVYAIYRTIAIKTQSDVVSVVSIEKTSSDGLNDIYTITYSNGTTSQFTITNGSVTFDDFYQKYLETHPDATYEQFLKDYLTVSNEDNASTINKILSSTLTVYSEYTVNKKITNYQTVKTISISTGSAVIYDVTPEYVYILTNYHVIYNANQNTDSKIARKVVCYLYGSEGVPYETDERDLQGYPVYEYGNYGIICDYVGGSATADIAILKTKAENVKKINSGVKAVTLAKDYHVGETAIAIGNPGGDGISVTEGIVSVDSENVTMGSGSSAITCRCMRIDSAIYHGSSGGGLFNKKGELIGITNGGNEVDQNINYAVPLSIVKNVTQNIINYSDGSVKKITLGVTVQAKNSRYVYDSVSGFGNIVEDITVTEVGVGSIAEKMALAKDDILKSFVINGTEYTLNRNFDIGDLLYTIKEGDAISIKGLRGDSSFESEKHIVAKTDIKKVD